MILSKLSNQTPAEYYKKSLIFKRIINTLNVQILC